MASVSTQRLTKIFVEVADTLVDEFDLIDFLDMLAHRAAAVVDAAAVGVLLADPRGKLQVMAGSDENVRLLELFQLQNEQGPCLEAYRTGRPVINVDLGAAGQRWPKFAPRASEAGFLSVHAFPMRLRRRTIGALNVFGATKGGDFEGTDVAVMQSLADIASIGLLQERVISRGEVLTEQLQEALNNRIVIEQAKGAVAQARGVTVDEAFASIRSYARGHNQRITDVAHTIVTDPATIGKLR